MIIKGNRHNNGAKLASYMMTGLRTKGEHAELGELRGFGEAENILDAFRDVEVMGGATRADNVLFHVQMRLPDHETLTPEQWQQTADRIEKRLGLTGQPRAVYFHIEDKTGAKHMHIGFSLIDADTMTVKPLPYFKFRFKALARQLEEEFDLTRVPNHREGPIKFAATKAQQEQDRRLGVNGNEVRDTIRACWDRSDCGRSFDGALADEALILVQGTRRDYLVMDHAGGLHALGKRILDVSATKVRDRLSDLDRASLPTIEQAREFMLDLPRNHEDRLKRELAEVQKQIEAEREYAERDPVREQMAWEDDLAKAAIAKEEKERKFAEPTKQGTPPLARAGDNTGQQEKEGAVQAERTKPSAPELGRTAGEIRLAYSLTKTGQEFANALEDRGFILACVTERDAERLNRWERQRLKQLDAAGPVPELEQGQEKRGAGRKLSRSDTWMAQTGGVQNLSSELNEKAQASYARWNGAKQKYDFADYVDYVQMLEATRRQRAMGLPEQDERYKAGELVAVNQHGHVFHITYANTGDGLKAREERLRDIDRTALLSVSAADSAMQGLRQQRRDEHTHERQNSINEQWSTALPVSEFKSAGVFEQAAREAAHDIRPEDLKGVAAKVWELWTKVTYDDHAKSFDALHASATPFSVRTDPKAFAAALDEKGIMFARATKEEAERSHREASFANAVGNRAPRFKEGEIVVITERPIDYSEHLPGRERASAFDDPSINRTGRIHKIDQSLARKFTEPFVKASGLDDGLRSIDATFSLSEQRLQKRRDDQQKEREKRATDTPLSLGFSDLSIKDLRNPKSKLRRTLEKNTSATVRKAGSGAEKIVAAKVTVGKAAAPVGAVAEKVFDVVAGMMDSLFTTTPEQAREAGESKTRRDAQADDHIEFSRYTGDQAQQHRNQQEQQAARDQQRERDRGGRER
jgi:hypothetical protein